ncbi:FG-GAP-like repeat-containing protein [candidate division KSB1 bacterium]|nr:FG-GAP-like repeat-containing protein [candidate division KSB1 bacterium]
MNKTKLLFIAAALVVAGGMYFFVQNRPEKTLEWHEETGFRWAELRVPSSGKAGFTPLPASKTSIAFANRLTEEQIRSNRVLLNGSGVAVGDADGDGWADVYFCRLDGPNVLYKNLGNWKFNDITAEAGVACPDRFSTGATFADIDGDGDLDLLVLAIGGQNACFLNDGAGKFTEATNSAGLTEKTGATSMALADIEGDGDLDLYIANYKTIRTKDIYSPYDLTFNNIVQKAGDTYQIAPAFQEHYTLELRGTKLLWLETAEADLLYLNDGQGKFHPVSFTDGTFRDEEGKPVPELKDWGLMARFQDMDDDGDPDIYVCNDFESPDRLWINDGAGHFQAAPKLAMRNTSHSSMAVDFSDLDRDGDLDFFVADMLSREHQRRKMQMGTMAPTPLAIGAIDNRPQYMRNTLFLNRGDMTYAEIAQYSGVEASEWSWSAVFLDVDLDGCEDLLVTTGNFSDVQDSDTDMIIRQRAVLGLLDYRNVIFMYPRLKTPNLAFRNHGDLKFEEVGQAWGFASTDISHGMALGDFDRDGDLDVVTNRFDTSAGVYRNESVAPRLAVWLRGLAPNTQGIGGKIRVWGGPVSQSKEVICGGYYASGSDPLYVFAAGQADAELSIEVKWRSGKRSIVTGTKPNRIYEIDESTASPGEPSNHLAPSSSSFYFEDVSDLIRHVHHEDSYDDFARQSLLPYRLSQLGPGVAWHDVDGDGAEDLIIASGKGGQPALFRNTGKGGFQRRQNSFSNQKTAHDQTAVLGWTSEGATSLLVGHSNFEEAKTGDAFVRRFDFKNNTSTKLTGDFSTLGPMCMADYDGDGDLDLFAGGRTIPGRYPEPASSRLYRNENGDFTIDQANAAPLKNIGLVCGAVFSDLDGDGDPELVLAIEWGPVMVFRNDAGVFRNATAELGPAPYTGWWNGVTTGDLNQDGKLDIIATNWGLNNKYHADAEHPVRIYYADFDQSGSLDIVEAHFDPGMNALVPERGLSYMSNAMPYVRSRTPTYKQFGGSNLREIIGSGLDHAGEVRANTLAHTIFFNRDDRFEAVALPAEAQFAPAFYVGVADFDGDGHEDVFLSQNFFAYQIETSRSDAGRGLWLKGDGTGKLHPVPGQESGIKVYGEQRGAALGDYDRDGRVDLVVTQNGAATKLYRNLGAKPGLRIRLAGPKENPLGVGATIRFVYADGFGPAREVHAGSGYWSQDAATQVMGASQQPEKIWVRWPGGRVSNFEFPAGAREMTLGFDGKITVRAE